MPFASVITPTRARPAALARAIRSLQRQDDPDWEAIVVDDGDGEGIEVVTALADPRVTALANAGAGQADARSTAIAAATGALVCWLDDDDRWDDPRHLTHLRTAAAAGERRFFFRGGWVVHEDEHGAGQSREPYDLDATPQSLRVNNTILTSSLAYPRALHAELGPLDRDLGSYADWDFVLRMCDAGVVPHRLPGLGVAYAVHDSNVSTAFDAPQRRRDFERFKAKHDLDVEIANHVLIHRMLGMSVPDGWAEVDGALERTFTFPTFPEAIAFVTRVAELAEAENHHPDIAVSYRDVTLRWRTHSAGAITARDRELAARSAVLA